MIQEVQSQRLFVARYTNLNIAFLEKKFYVPYNLTSLYQPTEASNEYHKKNLTYFKLYPNHNMFGTKPIYVHSRTDLILFT